MKLVELGEVLFERHLRTLSATEIAAARFDWTQEAPHFSIELVQYYLDRGELDQGELDTVRILAANGEFGRLNRSVLDQLAAATSGPTIRG